MASSDRATFLKVFEQLKKEILEDDQAFQHTNESRSWVEKNTDHNVPGGKLNRGLSVLDTLRLLKPNKQLTETETFKACALGWCIEWLQGYFLVMDDIMDKSITRRGQPCWYRMPNVGMIAINDAILLGSHIFLILRRHFKSEPCYTDLLDLFNEVTYQTASGQMLDLITSPENNFDFSTFNLDTYLRIVKFKTAYYSFYLPVACAMLYAGEKDDKKFVLAKDVLVQMGTYFQVQDDFLDCFGSPEVIGKIGTDIQDKKCSWLVVKALEIANENQKQIIQENYGRDDPKHISIIKQLYQELRLQEIFEEYERESYGSLTKNISNEPNTSYQQVFLSFLHKIYKRKN